MAKSRKTRLLSGNTVEISSPPSRDSRRQLNYAVDYSSQMAVVPRGFVTGLNTTNKKMRATNVSGKAAHACLPQGIGAGPDDKGEF